MAERKRKGIAPQEPGDLPNEQRCKQCFHLLGEYEDLQGNLSIYCDGCGITYKVIPARDRITIE